MIIYYFGDGKGKTTAALGTVLRAAGYSWSCLVLQAIKEDRSTGEQKAIAQHLNQQVRIQALGQGFIGIRGDKKPIVHHQAAAAKTLDKAHQLISQARYKLIVLDEYGDLPKLHKDNAAKLLALIDLAREKKVHLIITGHQKQEAVADAADLVTRMENIKHPYECGIMAEKGIDY